MSSVAKLGALGCALFLLTGCVAYQYAPLEPHEAGQLVQAFPQPVKNRVHVLFVHGHDPLDLACLSDLREYLVSLGLIKTYAGCPWDVSALCDAAGESFLREPDAKFVVVGHGTGCASLAGLVNGLNAKAIPVSLVVCLAPCPQDFPAIAGAEKVVTVVSSAGVKAQGEVHVVEAKPLGMPTHPRARTILSLELAAVAQQVGVVSAPLAPAAPRGEWGFLEAQGPDVERRLPIREAREMGPATLPGHE